MKKPGFLLILFALMALAGSVQAQTFYSEEPNLGPNQTGFGNAVAVGDGVVFVGEPLNAYSPGYVYVYGRGADGWSETAQLTAANGSNGDRFGRSLAVEGSTLLVGTTTANDERGIVYIFERNGDTWTQSGSFAADDLAEGDAFGRAVAFDGNVALVASLAQNEQAGAVYVFRRGADGAWTQEAKLTPSDAAAGDVFGAGLAVEGDVAIIGAPAKNEQTGVAYVFRNTGGTWTEEAILEGSGVEAEHAFGAYVSLSDGLVLISAPQQTENMGAVHTFAYDAEAGEWNEQAMLMPFARSQFEIFGMSHAFDGSTALVGAPGSGGARGAIYAMSRDDEGAWTKVVRLTTDDLSGGAVFGMAVDFHGDVAVAGIPGAGSNEFNKAAIFERGADGVWHEAAIVASRAKGLEAVTGGEVTCAEGVAGFFDCESIDLVSFLPVAEIGGKGGVRLNDIWGWTDPETGKEYAIVGRNDGTSFVDVSNPETPVFLGDLPKTEGAPNSTWRDMKVYNNHAFIVADGAGEHGMQVFDLTRLRNVENAPVIFEEDAHYDGIASSHNIVVNEDTGFAYAVGNRSGGETCGGGLHMINIQDPLNPTFAGCFADPATGRSGTGYSHDAQCVTYHGPDAEHQGREICFGSNETALSIADVTDKDNPQTLSSGTYPNVGYAHQGWLTDDHRYFFMNDELDELQGLVDGTRTLIWDLADLDDPQLIKEYVSANKSSDHNLYIKGNLMYQSNYQSGLRVLDISDISNPVEIGYFDTVPVGENMPGFGGSWSNYPYFQSGVIAVTSGSEGLFLLKKQQVDI